MLLSDFEDTVFVWSLCGLHPTVRRREENPARWKRCTRGAYQGDGVGGQVQHFDLVVVGVGHVKKPAAAASTDSSGLVEAGEGEIRAKSVSGLAGASQCAALLGLWIHYLDLMESHRPGERRGNTISKSLLFIPNLPEESRFSPVFAARRGLVSCKE